MVQPQARPSLSKRNWNTNKTSSTIPWFPCCLLIFVLQIGAILFVNKEVTSTSNTKPKPAVRRKRYHVATSNPKMYGNLDEESRPDSELPKNVKLRSVEDQIRNKFGVQQVKACLWYRRNALGKMRVVPDDDCDRPDQEFVVHNPLTHDRRVCGDVVVPAQGFARVSNTKCQDMTKSRLFPAMPKLDDATRMPPVKISILGDQMDELEAEDVQCDVPCRKMAQDVLVRDFSIVGTPWIMRYSMESATNYPEVEFDPEAHEHSLFYATTSFDSEVPLPYFSWDEYSIQAPPIDYDKVIKGASFIASNCGSNNEREDIVLELQKILRVDSLGDCLNNAEPPPGSSLEDSKSMKKQYLFHLSFENSNEMDYVTEKLWKTLEAGTLPVYMGAPNIQEHAPPNSIISWHDFDSTKELGDYLNDVTKNRTLYESYHAWRKQPLPSSFHNKYDFTHIHSICRVCRWAHARLYGYTFDHPSQSIQEPAISREVCWDAATQLVAHPVREGWLQGSQELLFASDDPSTCQKQGVEQTTQVGTWTRTVTNWDGVLDIEIEGTGEDGVYQLTAPIQGSTHELSPRHWQVQNSQSRLTLLTSWDAKIQVDSFSQGVIGIEMRGQKKMKIRIIAEDIEHFYPGTDKEGNYFGDLMVKDFVRPVERFLLLGD